MPGRPNRRTPRLSVPVPTATRRRIDRLYRDGFGGSPSASVVAQLAMQAGLPILEHLWMGAPLPDLLAVGSRSQDAPAVSTVQPTPAEDHRGAEWPDQPECPECGALWPDYDGESCSSCGGEVEGDDRETAASVDWDGIEEELTCQHGVRRDSRVPCPQCPPVFG